MGNLHWSLGELNWLRESYPSTELSELAECLGRSERAIQHKSVQMGLKKDFGYKIKDDFFDVWSADMAYILGFIITDGCVSDGRLSFGVASKDRCVLERISTLIAPGKKVVDTVETRKGVDLPTSRFRFGSQRILSSLERLGVVGRKTGRECLPDCPTEFQADLLRGIFDGDGGVSIIHRGKSTVQLKLSITSASVEFLRDIKNSLGFGFGSLSQPGPNCFRWNVYKQSDIKILHDVMYYPGFPFCLERKREIFSQRFFNEQASAYHGCIRTVGELSGGTLAL